MIQDKIDKYLTESIKTKKWTVDLYIEVDEKMSKRQIEEIIKKAVEKQKIKINDMSASTLHYEKN